MSYLGKESETSKRQISCNHSANFFLMQVSQYTFAMCSYREKKSEPQELMQLEGYTVDYTDPHPGNSQLNHFPSHSHINQVLINILSLFYNIHSMTGVHISLIFLNRIYENQTLSF